MSECGVCIGGDFGDGDPYEFTSMTWPKSRKEHRCGECWRIILKGEEYQRFCGKCDGEIYRQLTCHQCAEIREVFSCGEMWPMWGELWNDMRDVFPRLNTGCLAKLKTPEARELLRVKWMEWKGLHGKMGLPDPTKEAK